MAGRELASGPANHGYRSPSTICKRLDRHFSAGHPGAVWRARAHILTYIHTARLFCQHAFRAGNTAAAGTFGLLHACGEATRWARERRDRQRAMITNCSGKASGLGDLLRSIDGDGAPHVGLHTSYLPSAVGGAELSKGGRRRATSCAVRSTLGGRRPGRASVAKAFHAGEEIWDASTGARRC